MSEGKDPENSLPGKDLCLPQEFGAREELPSFGEGMQARAQALRPLCLLGVVPASSALAALVALGWAGYLTWADILSGPSFWILGISTVVLAASLAGGAVPVPQKPTSREVHGFPMLLGVMALALAAQGSWGLALVMFLSALGAAGDLSRRRRLWDQSLEASGESISLRLESKKSPSVLSLGKGREPRALFGRARD